MSGLSWGGIVRLGLVQTALGAIVVLTTSTINRVMAVELALPATLPGLLVGLHYAVQMMRPRMGWGSDVGGRRTPWIIGGILVLALGGVGAAAGTALMLTHMAAGLALATLAFVLVGLGVAAAGTSLLALLASEVAPARRPAAATIVWVMMIFGFAVTAGVAGALLDPFSGPRLVAVSAGVSLVALLLAIAAVWRIERPRQPAPTRSEPGKPFMAALREVWAEPEARRFSVFVFVSMLAYSGGDLILEPFAGHVFHRSVGESTSLAGLQNVGTLVGMIVVAVCGSAIGGRVLGDLRRWTVGGCVASAVVLSALAAAPRFGAAWPLEASYVALGLANGAFAAAAIASMMQLAGRGRGSREGTRMGLWGAAQAIAFGLGGVLATGLCDVARWALASDAGGYGAVFALGAALFLASAMLAARIAVRPATPAHALAAGAD
jgi:BCD family chlorophyll transporter-like MFS transporter